MAKILVHGREGKNYTYTLTSAIDVRGVFSSQGDSISPISLNQISGGIGNTVGISQYVYEGVTKGHRFFTKYQSHSGITQGIGII